jgi:uncharacterized FlgJ-related protein
MSIVGYEHLQVKSVSQPLDSIPVIFTSSKLDSIPSPDSLSLTEFSRTNLQRYILEKKIRHPRIVYAQALVETGEFTSRIYRSNNNLFGMKCVVYHGRPSTAIGKRYGHAVYTDWMKSVDDYLLWQSMFRKTTIEREDQYFALLRTRYAEDKRYVSMLKLAIQKDTTQWPTPSSIYTTSMTPFTNSK